MKREGNDLSPVLRKAWDRGELRSLVKNDPTKATGAHVSIVGHVTSLELRGHLTATEIGNGFGNRFLWICVQRSKMLPSSPDFDSAVLAPVYERLRQAVRFASFGETRRTAAAEELWHSVYPSLSRERYGVAGSLLSRAAAQVMRLAMIYSLVDLSDRIEERHLLAALECWRYVEDSVEYVFGQKIGDETADSIHDALKAVPDGMTRTQLSSHFNRHKAKGEIDHGLRILLEAELIEQRREQKKTGRPAIRFCVNRV